MAFCCCTLILKQMYEHTWTHKWGMKIMIMQTVFIDTAQSTINSSEFSGFQFSKKYRCTYGSYYRFQIHWKHIQVISHARYIAIFVNTNYIAKCSYKNKTVFYMFHLCAFILIHWYFANIWYKMQQFSQNSQNFSKKRIKCMSKLIVPKKNVDISKNN